MRKAIKRAVSLVTAAAMSAACAITVFAEAPTAEGGKFETSISAARVAEEMGIGLNLGNTMEAYEATNCEKITYEWIPKLGDNKTSDYETCWGAPVTTQELIDGMKEAGFSTVRIPVFWGNMMENDGTYTINENYLARVAEIVQYCTNDDLYAVINIHHFDEFIIRRNSLEDCEKIFNNLWTQIAEYFKDCPYNVVFEGYNEYLGGSQFNSKGRLVELDRDEGYELTNALNQTFVDAVRATGGRNADRVLVASGYWTNIDLTTAKEFKVPTDTAENRLMVSVHYVDNSMYWSNQIGSQTWKDYSVAQCELLKKAFTDKGIPVFVGETTSRYPNSNFARNPQVSTSSEALSYMLSLITDYGFVPVLWDTTGNFFDRDNNKIYSASDARVILGIAGELKKDYILGALNDDGNVNSQDAMIAVAMAKKTRTPTERQLKCGDLDRNGKIETNDAMIIVAAAKKTKKIY